ncbi:MAG: helix-turn-helix domain-containing protein [Candidatus Micrarchaeia archaeon]
MKKGFISVIPNIMVEKEKITKEVKDVLEKNGYQYVEIEGIRSCIDFMAEKKERKFVIKVVKNIDALENSQVSELKKIAQFIKAEPVVVGETSRNGVLKRNVTYKRIFIECVTVDGLESKMDWIEQPIAAKSVGEKIHIDGTKFRNIRKLSNMSAEEIAKLVGVSKSTIYRYERDYAYASLAVLKKLENVFNEEFIFKEKRAGEIISSGTKTFGKAKLETIRTKSMPFSMMTKGKINYYEVSLKADARTLKKRAKILKKIKNTFDNNYPFFVIDNGDSKIFGLPAIAFKNFRKIDSEVDLLSFVE